MKTIAAVSLSFFLLLSTLNVQGIKNDSVHSSPSELFFHQSIRNRIADAVIVSESDPYFSLIHTSIACWYDKTTDTTGLLPLLIHHEGNLTDAQMRFLETYFNSTEHSLLVLGEHLKTPYSSTEILGFAPSVAIALATYIFTTAPTVLILPYDTVEAYQLSLLAAPLASYLNIPVIIFDDNNDELQTVCTQLQTTHAYLVGDITLNLVNVTVTSLANEEAITETILTVIKDQFGSINYLTMTNPSDVVPTAVINTTNITFSDHITNKKIILLSKEFDLVGNDTRYIGSPSLMVLFMYKFLGKSFRNTDRCLGGSLLLIPFFS